MTLQDLLNNFSPINTKEKVDTLIQEMKRCGLKMTQNAEVNIRCAIQKANIQKYIIETYSRLFVEKETLSKKAIDEIIPPIKTKRPPKAKKKKKNAPIIQQRIKSVPSIMRVFGSQNDNNPKLYKEGDVAPHKKEYTTSFRNSISAISIPMGGANKRK